MGSKECHRGRVGQCKDRGKCVESYVENSTAYHVTDCDVRVYRSGVIVTIHC